jgi:hypothetical protein
LKSSTVRLSVRKREPDREGERGDRINMMNRMLGRRENPDFGLRTAGTGVIEP